MILLLFWGAFDVAARRCNGAGSDVTDARIDTFVRAHPPDDKTDLWRFTCTQTSPIRITLFLEIVCLS